MWSLALRRYVPQFDGVRALAISAVVAYHLGYLRGGWVGVDVFFVLSGYLITSLLLANDRPPGNLVAFWGRRARRLLPAVLVLLVALSVYAWAGGPGLVPAQLRAPALATLFYVANWQQIVAGHNYFAQYLAVSPLQQMWSLAIEEQYYLIWPLVLVAVTAATRARPRAGPAGPCSGPPWCSEWPRRCGWERPPTGSGPTGPTWAPTPGPGSS